MDEKYLCQLQWETEMAKYLASNLYKPNFHPRGAVYVIHNFHWIKSIQFNSIR